MDSLETKIKVKLSHPNARVPSQDIGDVGFDLYAAEDAIIRANKTAVINTGLQFAEDPKIDPRMHDKSRWSVLAKIEGRSGLASKGIFPVGGIVDPSYRGDIKVCLYNGTENKEPYEVKVGDRIAQLVLYPVVAKKAIHNVLFEEVEVQEESDRGDKGFGSSGR
jgi:dUTP pyrophosphatase